jgi:hypothetical protein
MQLPITKPGSHIGLRILAYYLLFFPSLDVMSAYPLVVHVLVNNIYIIITGKFIFRGSFREYFDGTRRGCCSSDI